MAASASFEPLLCRPGMWSRRFVDNSGSYHRLLKVNYEPSMHQPGPLDFFRNGPATGNGSFSLGVSVVPFIDDPDHLLLYTTTTEGGFAMAERLFVLDARTWEVVGPRLLNCFSLGVISGAANVSWVQNFCNELRIDEDLHRGTWWDTQILPERMHVDVMASFRTAAEVGVIIARFSEMGVVNRARARHMNHNLSILSMDVDGNVEEGKEVALRPPTRRTAMQCYHCRVPSRKTLRCTICDQNTPARYCGIVCQKKAWYKSHRYDCARIVLHHRE
jgi:hypothetical protein